MTSFAAKSPPSSRNLKCALPLLLCALAFAHSAFAQTDSDTLVHQRWYEARTTHFTIYSCGPAQEVYKVAGRLEQFHDAYSLLAGSQSVSSPPIIVIAFPSSDAMQPFLPVYDGKPANLAGFFKRSADENLIVLMLTDHANPSLDTIFHEYTHLLMRANDNIWPLWLQEGMAEIYSTFEALGHGVRIGKPIEHHLRELKQSELMPLDELMSVGHDSPQYNEADRQSVFYAESWALTHYLMNDPTLKPRFGQFTKLLQAGEPPEQAFTNALHMSLPAVEAGLRAYLQRDQFESIGLVVPIDLSAPRPIATRPIGYAETYFHLGDELMRIGRLDSAEPYFDQSRKIAPDGPLGYEGLGMLASERDQHEQAAQLLKQAVQRGSGSFLIHYLYAEEKLRTTSKGDDSYSRLDPALAGELSGEFQKSIAIMPDFGPAQHALGFLELVQGDDLAASEQHVQRAIQLEPENQGYLLVLAEVQMRRHESEAARRTIAALQLPSVDPQLRQAAESVLSELNQHDSR